MSEARPATAPVDPWPLDAASRLSGSVIDRQRTVCLPTADPNAIARAIGALANSRGGDIIVGAIAGDGGRITGLPGVETAAFDNAVAAAGAQIDPSVTHLVQRRLVAGEPPAGVVRVRLSPSAPHLVVSDGGIYRIGTEGVQPIRSRRALDDLYARGRGERERADRLVEAMIAKLVLGHYAFYGLAVVACTHQPSAEPYRAAAATDGWLAPADDPFIAAFGLHEHEPKVSPGEIELRTPGDVNAYLRVTRSGCVAAGEVQRRPYHDELDTAEHLRARLAVLCATVARVLGAATDALMLPQLFVEGVRGLKLVHDPVKRVVSGNAPQDTLRAALAVGDARDAAYVARLPDEAMDHLTLLFPPAGT